MLHEAELFVMAEQMLVEVLGRIGPKDDDIVLPPIPDGPGAQRARALGEVVARYADDEAQVPDRLGGRPPGQGPARLDPGLRGAERQAALVRLAESACEAARQVADGDAPVRGDDGDLPARDYLLRVTVARSLVAHYVAAYLGSTACPLPEELARPLWELTEPSAEDWRARGVFRAPMPLPDHVSWRDRFLLTAGHEPHPLPH